MNYFQNDSYQDQAIADTDEFTEYVKIPVVKTEESVEEVDRRRSSLFRPKFTTSDKNEHLDKIEEAVSANSSLASPHHIFPSIHSPGESYQCFDPPVEVKESIDFSKKADEDIQPKVIPTSHFSGLRQQTEEEAKDDSPAQAYYKHEIEQDLIGSEQTLAQYMEDVGSSLHVKEYESKVPSHHQNQNRQVTSPSPQPALSRAPRSHSQGNKLRRSSRFDAISKKEYAKVREQLKFQLLEEILRGEDDERKNLLTEEDMAFLQNYREQQEKQKTLAQRLDSTTRKKEMHHSILTQMEDLEKYKSCTFKPTIYTSKRKQIPNRSLQEFLLQQKEHLTKKERRVQQRVLMKNHSQSEIFTHQPKTLQKSAKIVKNREKSPYERLYSVQQQALKKQMARMMTGDSDQEKNEPSILSNKPTLNKARSAGELHTPFINKKSQKLKRDKPIGQHLYGYRKKDGKGDAQGGNTSPRSFINTQSYKLLYQKFKKEFHQKLAQMIHQVEEDKNALQDSTQSKFINRESLFSRDVLVALLAQMGYLMPLKKPSRELNAKQQKLISKLEDLCTAPREGGGIESNSLFQILAALSGFIDLFIYERPNVAFPAIPEQYTKNFEGNLEGDQNENSMTLHFFEEMKIGENESKENPFSSESARDSKAQAQTPFLVRGNIIEEKLESSDDLVCQSIFTEQGKLELSDVSARILTLLFLPFSKQRKEFELKQKLQEKSKEKNKPIIQEKGFQPKIAPTTHKHLENKIKRVRSLEKLSGSNLLQNTPKKKIEKGASPKGRDQPYKKNNETPSASGKRLFTSQLHITLKTKMNIQKRKREEDQQFYRECTFKPQTLNSHRSEKNLVADPTQRLYNRFKEGRATQQQKKKEWQQKQQEKESEECTFKPLITKSTSLTDLKNPYWSKNVEETVSRLKKARVANQVKNQIFKRGIPGTARPEESGFNFTIDKKFKPTFEDIQKKPRGKQGKIEKKSTSRLTGSQTQLETLFHIQGQKAKVAAVKLEKQA